MNAYAHTLLSIFELPSQAMAAAAAAAMANPLDFYFKVLNIPNDSSPQEIRSAYKSLVKKWHPDKHPPSSRLEAEAMFKAISQAYEVLNDQEDNRSLFEGAYSEEGGDNPRYGQSFTPMHPSQELPRRSSAKSSLSKEFRDENRVYEFAPRSAKSFGREFKDDNHNSNSPSAGKPARPALSSRSGPITQPKPPPVQRKLECTLEELCRGCKKEIKFMREIVMKNGVVLKKEESHTIKVKPGWKKGTKITFEGMGDERPGCPPPDVIYAISEKEHPVFKRVGNDLVLKVEVPLVNALTGWTFTLRLLTGEKASCSFQDEVIHPGYEKVVKGQGMPLAHEKGARGDLRIKFHIVFPKCLSDEQRDGLTELLKDCT